MEHVTPPLRLRASTATSLDRAQIVRLCQRAVSRSDYALRLLPQLVNRGSLFLAWDEDMLVGMTNFETCIDGSGWLSVARTDPAWRGHGVATYLQHVIAQYARQRGVRTLRLWVASDNKASRRACERGRFHQVCEAAHISRSLRTSDSTWKVDSSSLSNPRLPCLLRSKNVLKTYGYVGYRRHFIKLSTKILRSLRDRGELYSTDDNVVLITKPETFIRASQSSLTILEGSFTGSLKIAKEIARGMGARILSAYIPYDPYEIAAAKRFGFGRTPWGKHCLVFEKRI